MVRSASSLLLIGLVLGNVGCGAGTGNVSGKVMLGSKPVPAGRVTFTQGTKTAAAEIKSDGRYEAQGVPAGEVMVAVINPVINTTPTDKKAAAMMKGMQKTVGKDATPTAVETPAALVKIPTKYGDPEKSGLKVEVKRNETTSFDIDLK